MTETAHTTEDQLKAKIEELEKRIRTLEAKGKTALWRTQVLNGGRHFED